MALPIVNLLLAAVVLALAIVAGITPVG